MLSKVQVCVLLGMVCCANLIRECEGQRNNNRRRHRHGGQRNTENGLNPGLHRAYIDAVTGGEPTPSAATTVPSSWERLTPTLPAPGNVECTVEIPYVTRQGGRCIRTGGIFNRPYFCQSGRHLSLDRSCEATLHRRMNPDN